MKFFSHITFFVVALLSFGCASSHVSKIKLSVEPYASNAKYEVGEIVNKSSREISEDFISEVLRVLKADLEYQKILANEIAPATRKVEITITSYRMRSDFSRSMFGIFAGRDSVKSSVRVTDTGTGRVIGSADVSAYNMLAVGDEKSLARMYAYEILELQKGR